MVPEAWLRGHGVMALHDLLSDHPVEVTAGQVWLPPYARAWIG